MIASPAAKPSCFRGLKMLEHAPLHLVAVNFTCAGASEVTSSFRIPLAAITREGLQSHRRRPLRAPHIAHVSRAIGRCTTMLMISCTGPLMDRCSAAAVDCAKSWN